VRLSHLSSVIDARQAGFAGFDLLGTHAQTSNLNGERVQKQGPTQFAGASNENL